MVKGDKVDKIEKVCAAQSRVVNKVNPVNTVPAAQLPFHHSQFTIHQSGGSAAGRSVADRPVSDYDVFLAGQALQSHRASGMQFAGADADLGAQAVFKTVGELG